ncbi:hypothetical protein MLD38_002032 [Melastoma candidum]|uniref:Uncharacterized protein n=1 Tax=Melastoma candidum TaxID=119954 RepID=A0ACB9SNR4_9MYRT|nr:hypothetical protein MLD38_002032 [Melastoma candidum]
MCGRGCLRVGSLSLAAEGATRLFWNQLAFQFSIWLLPQMISHIADSDVLAYHRSLRRVSGWILSVTWNPKGYVIYSGSRDGSWRIRQQICLWSLLSLRSGTIISADGTGSIQFSDSRHVTLLQYIHCIKEILMLLQQPLVMNGVFQLVLMARLFSVNSLVGMNLLLNF